MTQDPTEPMRRAMLADQRANLPRERSELVELYGDTDVFTSDELRSDFEVLGFLAPFVAVRRKADGQEGSLMFQHNPRLYWGFAPDRS